MTAVETAAPTEHHDAAPTTVRLAALTRYEMRRYARHPLFPLGVGLTALTCYLFLHTTLTDPGAPSGYPSLFLGAFGIVIGFRLTQSTRNAEEVLDVAPASPQVRTGAAPCLAALVPQFAVGALHPGPRSLQSSEQPARAVDLRHLRLVRPVRHVLAGQVVITCVAALGGTPARDRRGTGGFASPGRCRHPGRRPRPLGGRGQHGAATTYRSTRLRRRCCCGC